MAPYAVPAARDDHPALVAGIVVFQPDEAQLLALIDTIAPDVDQVMLFLNSSIHPALREAIGQRPCASLIEATTNLGIGAALNVIVLAARWNGATSIILFDQDSQPPPDMIAGLVAAEAALVAAGHDPAVVAPRMTAAGTTASKAPTYRFRPETMREGGVRAADFVPTSGSLIRVDAMRRVGPFRADYFIDGIDLEWSFRAWSRGLSCWVALDHPMPHTVGNGTIAWPWLRFRMPLQRPFRMYCTVRNTLYGLRLAHVPRSWKARQIAYLPVQMAAFALHHHMARPILTTLAAGVVDGLRSRLGIPDGLPDSRDRF